MTGMSLKDATKLKKVPLSGNYPPEDTLPENGLYWYLLQPREEHEDQHKRATDRIWSKKTYRLREVVEDSGNWVMYYLSDGPERAFISEELMLITEDTELPPDYIQKWDRYCFRMLKNSSYPFSLVFLLFFQRHWFLRLPYLLETFCWLGTELTMHSKLHVPISF